MGRKNDRAKNRSIKKKLTNEQFKEVIKETNHVSINKCVNEIVKDFENNFFPIVGETLRENKISLERTKKILDTIATKMLNILENKKKEVLQ